MYGTWMRPNGPQCRNWSNTNDEYDEWKREQAVGSNADARIGCVDQVAAEGSTEHCCDSRHGTSSSK